MSIGSVRVALAVCFVVLLSASSGCSVSSSSTCGVDDTVACTTGTGYSCSGSDTPEDSDSSLTCSEGVGLGDGDTGYCCISFSSTTCSPDDTLTCPTAGSFGFTCAAGDDPTSFDPSLNCSAAIPDGANDDFCCE